MKDKYITVIFQGGLGNLLFQCATVIAAAIKHNMNPIFDENINIVLSKLPKADISTINFDLYTEKSFEYEEINIGNKSLKLSGYFQHWKYFDDYKQEILSWFNFKSEKLLCSNLGLSTVGVHVRRGDYLKFPDIHYNLTLNYYSKALSLFNNHIFLIFSDDIEWCKKCKLFSSLKNVVFMEDNTDQEDLILMSMCKNIIISNSSFSWWAAYISNAENIIHPIKWYNFAGPNIDASGYSVKGWKAISDLEPGLSIIVNRSINQLLCIQLINQLIKKYPRIEIIISDFEILDSSKNKILDSTKSNILFLESCIPDIIALECMILNQGLLEKKMKPYNLWFFGSLISNNNIIPLLDSGKYGCFSREAEIFLPKECLRKHSFKYQKPIFYRFENDIKIPRYIEELNSLVIKKINKFFVLILGSKIIKQQSYHNYEICIFTDSTCLHMCECTSIINNSTKDIHKNIRNSLSILNPLDDDIIVILENSKHLENSTYLVELNSEYLQGIPMTKNSFRCKYYEYFVKNISV